MNRRATGPTVIGIALVLLLCALVVPMLVVSGTAMLFAGGDGSTCGSTTAQAVQPKASTEANSIPANYLHWFQLVGLQYNVPWTVLAGIGKVESDDGQTTLSFATDYVTWNSKESKSAYGAKMASLVTAQEDTTLEFDFATAAAAAGNAVSTGSGTIDSITSFGSSPASITFSVAITQQVVPATGTAAGPSQYSITVVSTGAGWQVDNIELSSLGNQ